MSMGDILRGVVLIVAIAAASAVALILLPFAFAWDVTMLLLRSGCED